MRCLNLRPSESGLAPYEPIKPAVRNAELGLAGVTVRWPFPQLFQGATVTLVADETAIYELDEQFGRLTHVALFDPGDDGDTDAESPIIAGGPWHFADFQGCWLLSNGQCLVYKRSDDYFVRVIAAQINALCKHNQRLFWSMSDVYSESWEMLLAGWITRAPAAFAPAQQLSELETLPTNMVLWTNVNTLAMFWWLLDPTLVSVGDLATHDTTHKLITELDARGDWGFAPATFTGDCIALKPVGKHVIAYGTNGVSRYTPVNEYAPTCAVTSVDDIGIFGRCAVAGDDKRHLWLSTNRALMTIGPESGASYLDYKEFGAEFGPNVLGSYDSEQDVRYLSDGQFTLFQTESGIAQCSECPTGLMHSMGELKGVIRDSGDNKQLAEITIGLIDFGIRGEKTIDEVRCAGTLPASSEERGSAYASCEYRNSPSEDWQRDINVPLDDYGCAVLTNTALEHRIVIGCDNQEGMSINEVQLTWQLQDQRFTESSPKQRSVSL